MGESKRVYTIQFYRFYTQSILNHTQKSKVTKSGMEVMERIVSLKNSTLEEKSFDYFVF